MHVVSSLYLVKMFGTLRSKESPSDSNLFMDGLFCGDSDNSNVTCVNVGTQLRDAKSDLITFLLDLSNSSVHGLDDLVFETSMDDCGLMTPRAKQNKT